MFFLSYFFRHLFLNIKKHIEEIDESKKEQVNITFHFIVVIECWSYDITSMKLTFAETVFDNGAERCSFLWLNVGWIRNQQVSPKIACGQVGLARLLYFFVAPLYQTSPRFVSLFAACAFRSNVSLFAAGYFKESGCRWAIGVFWQ